MSAELWRTIDGFAGYYEVSTRGRVRSVARVIVDANGHRRRVPGRLLKLVGSRDRNDEGPLHCTLARRGEKVTYYPRAIANTKGGGK
ncbi:hypothetical protein MINTM020_37820 [Mycobacterium paraintracellulare]|uniref:NUMOD4 domain-containing protein n=1 Tax=Mycobacterium paraintracellulare TaxID=1138383 RepID=UPI0019274592|nr:NUMOD4 domain-containing protein [Mycobacterium paraintracellulare]BCP11684.1 hypothetical protein MINTM020_37820 [Mycobacterium paraintracellulare]